MCYLSARGYMAVVETEVTFGLMQSHNTNAFICSALSTWDETNYIFFFVFFS